MYTEKAPAAPDTVFYKDHRIHAYKNTLYITDLNTMTYKAIPVRCNDDFIFKVNKSSISAAGGAIGLLNTFKKWIAADQNTAYITAIIRHFFG